MFLTLANRRCNFASTLLTGVDVDASVAAAAVLCPLVAILAKAKAIKQAKGDGEIYRHTTHLHDTFGMPVVALTVFFWPRPSNAYGRWLTS